MSVIYVLSIWMYINDFIYKVHGCSDCCGWCVYFIMSYIVLEALVVPPLMLTLELSREYYAISF